MTSTGLSQRTWSRVTGIRSVTHRFCQYINSGTGHRFVQTFGVRKGLVLIPEVLSHYDERVTIVLASFHHRWVKNIIFWICQWNIYTRTFLFNVNDCFIYVFLPLKKICIEQEFSYVFVGESKFLFFFVLYIFKFHLL